MGFWVVFVGVVLVVLSNLVLFVLMLGDWVCYIL